MGLWGLLRGGVSDRVYEPNGLSNGSSPGSISCYKAPAGQGDPLMQVHFSVLIFLAGWLVLMGSGPNFAEAQVTVPNTFTDGHVSDSVDMNGNFTALVDGVNTALSNRETECAAAGGTGDAEGSRCTAASNYNCFIGGFCAQAAIEHPPSTYGYTNIYEGHTQITEPAVSAGCNTPPGETNWTEGARYFSTAYVLAHRIRFDYPLQHRQLCASD